MRPRRLVPVLAVLLLPLAAAALVPAAEARGKSVIFKLEDPRGDDHGDGSLVYPLRDDFQPGDLDLLSFSARAEDGGTTFEATFARPVRSPGGRTIDIGGGNLNDVARFGFYTFNLDVYIDMDRVAGSGSTNMLPGRVAEIAPENAWERAVCLTPRPYEAQEALRRLMVSAVKRDTKAEKKKKLSEDDLKRLRSEAEADIASRVFFPTRIRVTGPKISFFVPDAFLGGPAKDTWSYVVAVSGADVLQKFDVPAALTGATPSGEGLMILRVVSGRSQDAFGGAREDQEGYQPPLLDVIVPPGKIQEDVLMDYDPDAHRPVRLPGVVPADVKGK